MASHNQINFKSLHCLFYDCIAENVGYASVVVTPLAGLNVKELWLVTRIRPEQIAKNSCLRDLSGSFDTLDFDLGTYEGWIAHNISTITSALR